MRRKKTIEKTIFTEGILPAEEILRMVKRLDPELTLGAVNGALSRWYQCAMRLTFQYHRAARETKIIKLKIREFEAEAFRHARLKIIGEREGLSATQKTITAKDVEGWVLSNEPYSGEYKMLLQERSEVEFVEATMKSVASLSCDQMEVLRTLSSNLRSDRPLSEKPDRQGRVQEATEEIQRRLGKHGS